MDLAADSSISLLHVYNTATILSSCLKWLWTKDIQYTVEDDLYQWFPSDYLQINQWQLGLKISIINWLITKYFNQLIFN